MAFGHHKQCMLDVGCMFSYKVACVARPNHPMPMKVIDPTVQAVGGKQAKMNDAVHKRLVLFQ